MKKNNSFEILLLLIKGKELTINDIAKAVNISVMGASKIIKKLKNENLIKTKQFGRSIIPILNKDRDNTELFALVEKYNFNKFIEKNPKKDLFLKLKQESYDNTDFIVYQDNSLLIISNNKLNIKIKHKIITKDQFKLNQLSEDRVIINGSYNFWNSILKNEIQ